MKRSPGAILLLLLLLAAARAEIPLQEYASRLDRAAEIAAALFNREESDDNDDKDEDANSAKSAAGDEDEIELPSDAEILAVLEEIEILLPPTVEVAFDERVLSIDNAALHQAIQNLIQRYREGIGSEEERYDELLDVTSRVVTLAERVGEALEASPASIESERARLAEILARPEFQPDERRESRVQRWTRQMWESFLRFLQRYGTGSEAGRQAKPGTLNLVRALIAAALVTALAIGAVTLARRLRLRRGKKVKEAEREVLGEVIEAGATAGDLRAMAVEMARRGDFRAAIRRAYIALLYELDERGKLRLDRAKTNRDYLNELKTDPDFFAPLAERTEIFERTWYGERAATREDYEAMSNEPRL